MESKYGNLPNFTESDFYELVHGHNLLKILQVVISIKLF